MSAAADSLTGTLAKVMALRVQPLPRDRELTVGRRGVRGLLIDTWTSLSHKEAMQGGTTTGVGVPSWVGIHQRRLTAYRLLQAYQDNAARWYLPAITTEEDREGRREYGDAALIVQTILGALLGDDQSVLVDGADAEPPDGASPDFVTPEAERQDWLQQWADTARLRLKLIETERNAVGLGDGLYMVAWSNKRQQVVLRTFDPGFYFPFLDSRASEDDYPETVHVAWEEETADDKTRVRRITWQLRTLPDGQTKRYPYAPDVDSTLACYMTEATWEQGDVADIEDFSPGQARYEENEDGEPIKDLDLGCDFIPLIHVPNTVSLADHYGRSSVATVLQVLDDLSQADTDLMETARLLGSPPIALSGAGQGSSSNGNGRFDANNQPLAGQGTTVGYGPGTVWRLPEGGRLDVVDTSSALDALLKLVEHLLKRLDTNSRVPGAVLGRVDPGSVQAGIILALSFGPLSQMVGEMRLVRADKYPLLLKFVQRFAIVGGQLDAPVMPAEVAFGSYLPSDRSSTVLEVTQLLAAHAISLMTAVSMLVDAGFPIDDAAAEVERIRSENYAAAAALLAATGDEKAVFDYLGLEPPAPPTPEPIVLPPLTGQPPAGTPSA